MPQILFSLPLYYEKYKEWIQLNPQQASEMETGLKWISYFVAGRIRNSHTVSEMVYFLSNLLILHNDRIIVKLQEHDTNVEGEVLKVWLTVLEYSEVFLELSAESIWGVPGKWALIILVQLFKCICRILLVYYYKHLITESPPIPPLSRNDLLRTSFMNKENIQNHLEAITLTLSRSGRILRKVNASPALQDRSWKVQQNTKVQTSLPKRNLEPVKLTAETVYICRPIIHLGSIAFFGKDTWKPWMLSLGLDLFSLYLYEQGENPSTKLDPHEKLLISRRYISLLLYLVRSPFYEGYTKGTIKSALHKTGQSVPLCHFITKPILKYLPFWRSIYFYMWST